VGLALTDGPARRIERAPSALWRRSVGVTYVLGDGDVVVLGGPAAVLWELLADPHTADDAVATVAELHGVQPAVVDAEVRTVLDDLGRRGLLSVAGPMDRAGAPTTPAHRSSPATVVADDPAAALAGWHLAGCPLQPPDPAVAGWPALLESVRRERLSGLAAAAHRAGDLPLPDEADVASLRDAHRDAMLTSLRLERLLLETVQLLEDAGVEPVVIKGPSIAHRRYDDPSMRPFGDIDLLVPPAQLDHAFATLTAAGHQRRYPQPRPGFDQRFGKGAAFVVGDGLELDVHRTFAAGPFGMTVDVADAHRSTATFAVGGRTLRSLGDAATLVSLSMHAVLGTRLPRLLNLRDVAQVASQIDVDEAIARARRWRVDAAGALAARHAAERFALAADAPLVAWAAGHVGDASQRRALRAYTTPQRSYARQAIAALPAVRGTRNRAAYLRAMVLPDRSYVAGRDGSRGRRWLRMARGRSAR
jgi:hypothetical protein